MLLYSEFQRFNPFCEPDWRFARVTQLERDRNRCTRRDDEYIRRARVFYQRWQARRQADRESLLWREPGLYYAMLIHEEAVSNPHNSVILEAKLLAGEDDEAIAQTQGMLPEAVHWYEAMFFNVRPRLESWCWVVQQVLIPAALRCARTMDVHAANSGQSAANAFLDESLKSFGFFGGPKLLDFMIAGFHRG